MQSNRQYVGEPTVEEVMAYLNEDPDQLADELDSFINATSDDFDDEELVRETDELLQQTDALLLHNSPPAHSPNYDQLLQQVDALSLHNSPPAHLVPPLLPNYDQLLQQVNALSLHNLPPAHLVPPPPPPPSITNAEN